MTATTRVTEPSLPKMRALTWVARLFLAIGIGAAIVCLRLAFDTLRFISEST